jgi:hypothetical protein
MGPILVNSTIVDQPVLDLADCADVCARLEAIRSEWLVRGTGFATIGVAAYLDIMNSACPEVDYYGRLAMQNRMLRSKFPDVLDRIAEVLRRLLDAPVRFDAAVALPGFHVFEDKGITVESWPSQHFDLQHRAVRWPFDLASEEIVSFTLALRLPRLGGALDFWDLTEGDLERLARLGRYVTMESLGITKPVHRHEYQLGSMAVQLRPVMHRIAAITQRSPGDQRITLQGHGVRDSTGWVLYW